MLAQPDATIASIARLLGVSRSTLCKYVPELRVGGGIQAIEPVTWLDETLNVAIKTGAAEITLQSSGRLTGRFRRWRASLSSSPAA